MSENNQGYIPEPKNMEEAHHNVQFQLDNVSGWIHVKHYGSALIKVKNLVEALEYAISIDPIKK